jgi:hypothetical protein
MRVFGVDLVKDVPWAIIGYIIINCVALFYATSYINSINQIRGIVFGILAAMVLIYFGIKWFGTKTPMSTSWPPVINMCPDYLTHITFKSTTFNDNTTTSGCVDLLGVGTGTHARKINKITQATAAGYSSPTKTLTQDEKKNIFEYTSADVKAAKTSAELERICKRCEDAKLTWEGVYDGDSCIGLTKPAANQAALEYCLLKV